MALAGNELRECLNLEGYQRAGVLVPIILGIALDSVRVVSLLHDGAVKKVTIIAASTCVPRAV